MYTRLNKEIMSFFAGADTPCAAKLNGHSDADVALHALTMLFLPRVEPWTLAPTSAERSAMEGSGVPGVVEHAVGVVRSKGGRIANVDVTLNVSLQRLDRIAGNGCLHSIDAGHRRRTGFRQSDDQRKTCFIGMRRRSRGTTASVVFRERWNEPLPRRY